MPLRIVELAQRNPPRVVHGCGWLIPDGPHLVSAPATFAATLSDGRTVGLSARRYNAALRALRRRLR